MTQKQKENHLTKVVCSKALLDPAAVNSAVDSKEDVSGIAAVSSENIRSFDDYNFPECLRGSWANAYKIIQLDGIGPFPNNKRTARGQCYLSRAGQFAALKSVRQARNFPVITAVRDLRRVTYVLTLLLWPSKWES